MNNADTASARHHTYLLISRLYLEGLADDLLPYIAQIPEIAAVTPRPFDLDEAAAAHYQIFAHDIFPYESIFRDPSGLLGGIFADQVQAFYMNTPIHITAGPDHIGHEIGFLGALCREESHALLRQDNEAAAQHKQLQRTFLLEHLLCWAPPFVASLSFSQRPFFAALGQLMLNLLYDHLLSLQPGEFMNPIGSHLDGSGLEIPDVLQNGQTSLKQIAVFLITPPHSGLYLGQSAISALARDRQLPRGFGSRQQMLSNLFHTAAQYDLIPELLHDLSTLCGTWTRRYKEQLLIFPRLSPWIEPWQDRLNNTSDALLAMRKLSITAG